ncbi:hypothetical protein ACKFKG_31170 [Phormidesmis sp. 146-35]
MVNKKAKSSKTEATSIPTSISVKESPVLETAIVPSDPIAEPTKKKTRSAKKITKTDVVEPIVVEPTPQETVKEEANKNVKMKRLTLDIAKPLHKAIKAKAVEEGIPMVDMLRSLLETHYGTH